MSHIVKLGITFKDLNVLKKAVVQLGAEYRSEYTYTGYYSDQKLKCEALIRVPGCKWDVGIVKDGNEYALEADAFVQETSGGKEFLKNIRKEYAAQQIITTAKKQGHSFKRTTTAKGETRIEVQCY